MGWYSDWRLTRATRLVEQHLSKREVVIPDIVVRADGIVPDTVFTGSDLETNYMASVWAHAALAANAELVASLPVIVQRQETDERWVRLDGKHPLKSFAKRPLGPSDPQRRGWQYLSEMITLQLQLAGNAYLYPFDLDTQIAVQPLLKPHTITAKEDKATHYPLEYTHPDYEPFPADKLCNIQNANPGSFWKGVSLYNAALKDVAVDNSAHVRVMYNLWNRVGASLFFQKSGFFGMPEEQQQKILKYLADNYQSANKDGMPLVMGDDIKIEKVPSQDPGTYIFDVRKLSREGIMAITRVPPPILGLQDNATLQNFAMSLRIWWYTMLFPLAGAIFDAINTQIVAPRYGDDIRLWYDITGSPIGIEILKDKAEAATMLVDKLGYPANMANDHVSLGMPRHPDLDEANVHLKKAGRDQEPKKEPVVS